MKVLLCLILAAACIQIHGTQLSITLDPADKCHVTWSFDSTDSSGEITFKIEFESTGWVGIGLSPNGGMAGSDIIVGWVDSNGKAHIQDMHAVSNSLPLVDKSQDVELISGSEESGKTTLVFRRKINTCDQDDSAIESTASRLIYAYGERDPTNNMLTSSDYHSSRRGVKTVYMLDSVSQVQTPPEDALHFDLFNNNYEIPPVDTTYHCSFIDPPALPTKHHIISTVPIIEPANLGLVHHIVVYGCWNVSYKHMRNSNETGGVCHTPEMPEFADSCTEYVYIWGVGGSPYYYPDHVGLPIGGGDGETPEFYMLEIHYDNSQLLKGRHDSSGVRFTYTPTLRQYDAALVGMGNTFGIVIPPEQEKVNYVTFCHSDCTRRWIPKGGVTLLSYALHGHLAATAIKAEWYRDGKMLEILAHDDNYDFNYQEFRLFKEEKKLMPGDTIKVTCSYQSEGRNNITFGGLPTESEMCYFSSLYYPKQLVTICGAFPDYYSKNDSELYNKLSVKPRSSGDLEYTAALSDVTDWTLEKVAILQEHIYMDKRETMCLLIEGELEKGTIDPADFPEIVPAKDEFCANKDKNVNNEVYGDGNTAAKHFASHMLIFTAVLGAVFKGI